MEDAEETVLYTVTFRLAKRSGFGVRPLGVLNLGSTAICAR
jgi:hypothetical protein